MPIEIKELKVNIQVRDKNISLQEIEKMVMKLLHDHEQSIKQDFINTISKKEKINTSR